MGEKNNLKWIYIYIWYLSEFMSQSSQPGKSESSFSIFSVVSLFLELELFDILLFSGGSIPLSSEITWQIFGLSSGSCCQHSI